MYKLEKDRIIINKTEDFCPKHILECGQIFSYDIIEKNTSEKDLHNAKNNVNEINLQNLKNNSNINKNQQSDLSESLENIENDYIVYSADKMAKVVKTENGYEIITNDVLYFENFFDLKTDYTKIKNSLKKDFPYLEKPIEFGSGIRLLNQDIFETIISFIISANNNIKRIQKIVFAIREKFGKDMGTFHAFPTIEELKKASVDDFKAMGAGYRAEYLYKAVRQLENEDLEHYKNLTTEELNKKLLSLMGVGQKVSDCIMLFAFSKRDVFPVDTWIEKVYATYFDKTTPKNKIRQNLLGTFGERSGFAQQYLFYSQRSWNLK